MSKKSVKKSRPRPKRENSEITVDQAMRFLDDSRTLYQGPDEPTRAISIRVPENVLRSVKLKAKAEGKKYQSVIVALMRRWIIER